MEKAGDRSRAAILGLAAAFAALFVLCSAPKLSLPGLEFYEAEEGAEAVIFLKQPGLFGAEGVPGPGYWAFGRAPWMHMHHMGTVKTYALAAAFSAFGISPTVMRSVTVAFGAAAVFFLVLLAGSLYGAPWALASGLWLSTDPALIIMARHDLSALVSIGLKSAALFLFAAAARRRSPALVFLGAFLFGLCLWEKINFLWFIGATAAPLLLFVPAERWLRKDFLAAAFAGLVLGASPLLVYNLVYPLRTFASQQNLNAVNAGKESLFWAGLPLRVELVLGDFVRVLSGQEWLEMVTGPYNDKAVRVGLRFVPLLAAAGALLWRSRADWRKYAFWPAATAFAVAAACLTPAQLRGYHTPMFYPLPHLAVLAALAGAVPALGARARPVKLALALFLAGSVSGNALVVRDFYRRLAVTEGYGLWHSGIARVARLCLDDDAPVVVPDFELGSPLVVYLAGRKVPRTGPWPLDRFAAAGTKVVAYEWQDPDGRGPARQPRSASGLDDPRLKATSRITDSDGRPWATVYTVR